MKIPFYSKIKPQRFLFFILLLTSLIFLPALFFGFTNWDDESHFLQNRDVITFNIPGAFQNMVNKTYIPLTTLSFAIEHYFFGFNPFVFHLTNLVLHLIVTGLVFLFARRLGFDELSSGLAALIFAVHPMHVETVAWVTERKGLLYSIFYLLALLGYCSYIDGKGKKHYVLSLVYGFLSILAKPMALSLPLVLFLCDWFKGRKRTIGMLADKIPYCLYLVPVTLLTYALNARVMHNNLSESLLTWVWTLTFYVHKFFWPIDVSPLYVLPKPVSLSNPAYIYSIITVFIVIGVLIYFRKKRWLTFAFLYYFLSIFFLLRFDDKVDITFVADRYMYLPSLGLCLLGGLLIKEALTLIESKKSFILWAGRMAVVVLITLMFVKSQSQSLVWKDSLTLWNRIISSDQTIPIAFYNRGVIFDRNQNLNEALSNYNKTIEAKPEYADAYNLRGTLLAAKGQYKEAISDLNKAIEINPTFARVFNNRGNAYLQMGKYDLALTDLNKAIEIDPGFVQSYNNRGLVFFYLKAFEQALADFDAAIALDPQYADAYYNQGNAYKALKRHDDALYSYNKAININFRYVKAYNNRGNLHTLKRDYNEAIEDYHQAIKLESGNYEAYNNRGVAYRGIMENTLALDDFNKALSLNPAFEAAYSNRGDYYLDQGQFELALIDYNRALELNPKAESVYLRRSLTYASKGEFARALEDARQAKSFGVPDMDIFIAKIEKLQASKAVFQR